MFKRKLILIALSTVWLSGCAATFADTFGTEEKQSAPTTNFEYEKLKNALRADLTSEVNHAPPPLPPLEKKRHKAPKNEERFDINMSNIDIKTFAANISTERDVSIVVHPDVDLNISMQLRNTTLSKALFIVGGIYNLDVRFDDDVYFIYPTGLRTETFSLSYINLERKGSSNIQVNTSGLTGIEEGDNSSGGGGQSSPNSGGDKLPNGTTIKTKTEIDIWSDIKEALTTLIGEDGGRAIIVSPQTGTVTVKGFPDDLYAVRDYLHKIEFFLNKQVVLEARILEVELNENFQQGVDWEYLSEGSKSYGASNFGSVTGNDITGALGGLTNFTFSTSRFSSVIDLLSTQGDVQTLSSPRITASNNQKAVIKVGEDEYYVTNVSTTTVTGNATTVTPEIDLKPFFSGISLDVTPHINDNGEVLLHVHPSVINTTEKEKVITLNQENYILPLAHSSVRESDTIIKAETGNIVVIGGLIQSVVEDKTSGVPLLKDIPYLGKAFSSVGKVEKKRELVILIRPTIVNSKTRSKSHELLFDL